MLSKELAQLVYLLNWPNGIIFHQPGISWNKGISLTKPPFGVRSCEVAIIWPDIYRVETSWLNVNDQSKSMDECMNGNGWSSIGAGLNNKNMSLTHHHKSWSTATMRGAFCQSSIWEIFLIGTMVITCHDSWPDISKRLSWCPCHPFRRAFRMEDLRCVGRVVRVKSSSQTQLWRGHIASVAPRYLGTMVLAFQSAIILGGLITWK